AWRAAPQAPPGCPRRRRRLALFEARNLRAHDFYRCLPPGVPGQPGAGGSQGDYGSARSPLKSNGNDSAAPQAPTPAVLKFSCVRASRLVFSAAQVNAEERRVGKECELKC